jgi:hypothetical protein
MSSPRFLGRSEDLALGQGVIIAARWAVVAAGLILAVIAPPSAAVLRTQVLLILGLAVCNFALQAQILRRRRTLAAVAYAASAADIAIITALVVADGGFASGLYVFYFPAMLALSVAFPLELTIVYAAAILAAMVGVAWLTMPADGGQDIVIRCLMLVAVALCGVVYAGIERSRRRRLLEVDEEVRHAAAG